MKYYKHLFTLLFSLIGLSTFAQTNKKTLNYQAVILDPKAIDIPGASIVGQPLNKGKVCLRFSLLNAQGGLDYEETQQVTTDEFGLVSVAIGTGTQAQASNSTSIYKSFESIVWNANVKSLKVSVSYDGCNSFKQVSTQIFNYTPYALYAEAVDYKNVREAPTKLSQFSNDAGFLIPKDLDPLKTDIQANSSKIEAASKSIADNKQASDAAFLVVNQSISSLDKQVAQNTSSITTINTKLTDQQNQITSNNNTMNAQIGGLQGQINNTNNTVSNLTGVAEMQSNKSTAINLGGANPSDQAYPSQRATKAYVDNAIYDAVGSGVPDATTLAAGKVKLAGDLGGTAMNPTVPALANKENTANKSINVVNDGGSDTKYPSVKAVKDYVDQATYGTALAADLANKANILSPTFTGVPTAPTPASTDNSTKLATTAFVQAATAGIALQASVDAKADKASPALTGVPTAPTPASSDNSTQIATTAFVQQALISGVVDATSSVKGKIALTQDLGGTADSPTVPGLALKANTSDVTSSLALKEDASNKSNAALGTSTTLFPTQSAVKTYVDAQVAAATIADADASTKGKLQLAGDLGGTAAAPTVPGLLLKANSSDVTTSLATKEDVSRKSTATDLGAGSTSDILYPSQKAVKSYVDTQVAAITIGDAVANTKGKIQLAGDLTGTADAPSIATGAINSAKIQDRSIATDDIADAAITNVKISDVSGTKVTGDIAGNAANVTGTVAVGNGGTGATNLSGYVKGNGSSAMTSVSTIPVADVTGAIRKVNGTLPNASGDVTIAFGEVTTGTLANRPLLSGDNGDIYIVSGDANSSFNGRTYISDGTNWNEVTANVASTDARYLQLAGGVMDGNISFPTGKKVVLTDAPSGSTDAANKAYVDSKISEDAPNATTSVPGKVQLTGDLGGSATAPTVPGLVLKAPINSPAFTGTVTGITKSMVGLGNVDNTADADKPVSTAAQAALNLKAPLASPTFTGTVSGITKAMVDLANVDNTSDANKPVSSAAQTALNLKAPLASPTFTGTVTSPIYASAPQSLTDAATISWNPANGLNANVTLGGNRTLSFSTAPASGSYGTLVVTQDGTGGRTLTLPSGTNKVLGSSSTTTIALSSSAGAKDILNFYYDGLTSTYYWNVGQGYGTAATVAPINLVTGVTGTLALGNGGTGATTAAAALTNLGAQSTTNLSTDVATDAASTSKYPAVKAIKDYVDASVTSGAPDANATTKGKIQLAGDLAGTGSSAAAPVISDNAITTVKITADAVTSAKIADGAIVNADINTSAAIADTKLATIATSGKVSNSATTATDANTASTIVARDANGNFTAGTITANLTGNAATATTATSFSGNLSGDVTGTQSATVVGKINGTSLAGLSTGLLKNTTTTGVPSIATAGTDYAAGTSALSTGILKSTTTTGALTIAAASDFPTLNQNTTGTSANVTGTVAVANGGTGATTAAAALTNLGAQSTANLSTDVATDAASTSKYPAVKTIKDYVDTQISSATIADANAITKGKIQLAGDLAGTNSSASAPVISNSAISTAKIAADAVTSAKILDGEIVNADISTTAAIADTKLATIATSGKVSNSATTATADNTASAIVARDANGNFTAGTITANLTGLASKATNINGGSLGAIPYQSAANTTTLLTGNTAATKKFLTQTGDGSAAAAPVWAGVAVSDITGTLPVANGGIGVTTTAANLVFAGPTSGATPAAPSFRSLVAADLPTGSTNYVNNGTTQQASTDFNISGSGTIGTTLDVTGNTTIGGTATITGATTLSALTATKGVFTDASKRLTSVGTLGTDQGGTGMASFNNGGAMYATSTSALTTGTLPTSAGGTGLTSYTNGGALYTTSTTAITSGTLPISAGGTGATTAAAALTSLGAQSTANLSTDVAADAASTSKYLAVKTIKDYVDAQIVSGAPNATTTATGKVQLAGDLAGTGSSATAPVISDNAITTIKITADAVTSAKIADGAIVNADINTSAAIADTKLATIATSGKVSNSATTATDANTASAIVARDANGNFTAGTITANLTGNATNVTGTVAIANGGTGVTTAAANAVFAGPTSGASPAAPSFRGLVAADLPSGSTNYINNTTTQQSASFNISGSGTIGTDLTLSALTASKPVFTDANKKLTSAGTLGISQGGTGLTATPTNGQILIGNGTGFTLANLSQGTGISISTGTGSISIAAAVRPTTDQFSATANQTSFTLTQTPLTNANSKDNVWMFINGVRTNNDAYSVSGTTVTYVPGSNGSYALLANDRIQFDYMY